MLKTTITSPDAEALNELQTQIYLSTDSTTGFGDSDGVLVNPLIKHSEDGLHQFSIVVGPKSDINTNITIAMEDISLHEVTAGDAE